MNISLKGCKRKTVYTTNGALSYGIDCFILPFVDCNASIEE